MTRSTFRGQLCFKNFFLRMINNSGKPADERDSLLDLGRKQVRMIASKEDGSTPQEVDMFSLVAMDSGGQAVQSNRCQDCLELKSDILTLKIDELKTETMLLTAGTVAGILWLAILSG